ncbi:MAG: tyrosine-type recombinase/integrase [Dehalococcoidia bacterium]|nr:tyrosine-type recombinase/integrase [Dehalococcoidia bacterium]
MGKRVIPPRRVLRPPETAALLHHYRLCLEAANRSQKTIAGYLQSVPRFLDFAARHFPGKSLEDIGPEELRAYVRHLQQATRWAQHPHIKKAQGHLSSHSVQGAVRDIKAFWNFLGREGYLEENPLAGFPLPKTPQKPVSTLQGDQIRSLLGGIDRDRARGALYSTVLQLLLDTGLRISEATGIRMSDLDLPRGWVKVTGKGGKIRVVPLSAPCRRELQRYLRLFRPQLAQGASDYLFPRADGSPLSINSVQQYLRRLANHCGLAGVKCTPHTFRHTFATESIAHGANVFVLKEVMGHSSLQTTLKYVHIQPAQIQAQHAQFSPLANLNRHPER